MGFLGRLANAWKILVLSFRLLGRDKSLAIIPSFMLISTFLVAVLFFIIAGFPIYMGFFPSNLESAGMGGQGYALLIGFGLLFLQYFWTYFLAAAQSWMVYEVLQGKDTTVASGVRRALHNMGDIAIFSLVMMLLTGLRFSRRRGSGFSPAQVAGSFISYLAGVAGRLVLPGMIITEKSFMESVKDLKKTLQALPEIAAYEVGVGPLMTLFFFGVILFAVFIGTILPAGISIFILIIGILLLIAVTAYANTTYYTILYLTLIEQKRIPGLNLSS